MKKIILISVSLFIVAFGLITVYSQPSKKDFMNRELNKIEKYLIHRDSLNTEVSKVAVAWHLDHSLKVINGIYDSLRASNPENYSGGAFSLARIFSYTFGYIPRGRATSPASVTPPDTIQTSDIVSQLLEAREKMMQIESLDKNSNFKHPVFGQLNRKQSQRFLEVHTKHHLKIIRDILKE